MKGLLSIPSEAELARIYDRLQAATDAVSTGELAVWSQFARLDPRLAEQLITHIAGFWRKIPPMALNEALIGQAWPAALGVLLEHVLLLDGMKTDEWDFFSRWKDWVMVGVSTAPDEQFFIGLRALGGAAMRDDAAFSLTLYRKWGFLGRDVLLNKWKAGRWTLVPSQARKVALNELLKQGRRFTVRDYRAILRNEVSIRQAELDLNEDVRIRAVGATRGRFYVRR